MRPERIVPDCFAFYLLSRYGMKYHEGTCLIDLMMHAGKINYVVQNLLGYNDSGEAMGYSKEESDWCKENEKIFGSMSVPMNICTRVTRW